MKLRTIGHKLSQFGDTLGKKLASGVRNIGHKIYDNRYKILGATGALGAGLLLGQSQDAVATIYNTAQNLTPQFLIDGTTPKREMPLSERLKAQNPNVFVPFSQQGR